MYRTYEDYLGVIDRVTPEEQEQEDQVRGDQRYEQYRDGSIN